MNNSTNITYERVRQNADSIMENSKKMNTIFQEFNGIMNNIGSDDVFQGVASEAQREKFNSLKGKFDAYTSKVQEFSAMISHAADQTEATEKGIASQADNLNS